MNNDDRLSIDKEACPNNSPACAVSWTKIEGAINVLHGRIISMEEKMKIIPSAWEFRIAVFILVALNPKVIEVLGKAFGVHP